MKPFSSRTAARQWAVYVGAAGPFSYLVEVWDVGREASEVFRALWDR